MAYAFAKLSENDVNNPDEPKKLGNIETMDSCLIRIPGAGVVRMKHEEAAGACTNRLEPTSDEVKDVYARFGLAYYCAEVLHRDLCNLYCLSQIPTDVPITRPRVEEHLRTAFETTLGQLLLKLQPILSQALITKLEIAVERRNFLAHRFWFERVHLMTRLRGIETMVKELSDDADLFSLVDAQIEDLTEPLLLRFVTPELLLAKLHEIQSGKVMDPINPQRKPKKEETIVAVFDIPTRPGLTLLIFQTQDGALWQLCDIGLGWTTYDKIDPSWPAAKKFDGLLPAKINPRPIVRSPWTFEIQFGPKVKLSVRLRKSSGEVFYTWRLLQNHGLTD